MDKFKIRDISDELSNLTDQELFLYFWNSFNTNNNGNTSDKEFNIPDKVSNTKKQKRVDNPENSNKKSPIKRKKKEKSSESNKNTSILDDFDFDALSPISEEVFTEEAVRTLALPLQVNQKDEFYLSFERNMRRKPEYKAIFTQIDMYFSNRTSSEKYEIILILTQIYDKLYRWSENEKIRLEFNEELSILIYLILIDIAQNEIGYIKRTRIEDINYIKLIYQKYDKYINLYRVYLNTQLDIFARSTPNNTIQDSDNRHDVIFTSISPSYSINTLFKNISRQFGHYYVKTSSDKIDLRCSLTQKHIKQGEEFYLYQHCLIEKDKANDAKNSKQKSVVTIRFYPIASIKDSEDPKQLLHSILAIVNFLTFKNYIIVQFNKWREERKFASSEKTEIKWESFRSDFHIKLFIIYQHVLFFNNFKNFTSFIMKLIKK